MKPLKRDDRNDRVKAFQKALERKGFILVRFGADGHLGFETLEMADRFADAVGWNPDGDSTPNDTIPLELEQLVLAPSDVKPAVKPTVLGVSEVAPGVVDARALYGGVPLTTKNDIAAVTCLIWHQTACLGSIGYERWLDLAAHGIVAYKGPAAVLHDVDIRVPHAQGFNPISVGNEVEGHFAGVVGKPKTHWVPKDAGFNRTIPMEPSPSQIKNAIELAAFQIEEVKKKGGQIKHCGGHRQSYGRKVSDPGELIFKTIVIPVMKAHNLTLAPTLWHKKYPGKPIPEAWDPSQKGVKY